MVYFLKESPFGDDVYVVVMNDTKDINKKMSELYKKANGDIAVVVLTGEEYKSFETLLQEKGERLY
ncbi:hypothetical protein [Thermotoga profunda]|uniref:hypothetical protein n=1 Tax=Thermotoga profunda TaxID=1508420 RepID=UPI001E38C0C5|nr:hypothetical protein [Thermotoga profunda]